MNPEMTIAFIVVCVYGGIMTCGYFGEWYQNRKLKRALKNRGKYAKYKESRDPAATRNAASKNTVSIF